jgi:pimeloyl-ACP methyl ester carboxylesterase
MATRDLTAPGGRILHVHEAGDPDGRAVVVHHGTPTDGALFHPWVADAEQRRGVGPFDAAGLNFFAGMGADNIVEFGAAMQGRDAVAAFAEATAAEMGGASAGDLIEVMRSLVTPVDAVALERGYGEFWSAHMGDVFRQGVDGWIGDDLAFVAPFGFAVEEIAVPVLVWHGRHDRFVPVSHGEWLARAIPHAEARITVDDGHITIIADRIPAVHEWLLRRFE